jgi:ATP-dependent RNA helicase DeaD
MAGHDMVGQAHTGTGKTAAFGLPGLNSLKIDSPTVQMLVITPTRELANQVSEEIYKLGKFLPVHTAAVYGGQSYTRQIDSIHRGAQVVVATPGRLLDLLKSGRLKKQFKPTLVVLDEADEMLDMGFLEDIQKIFSYLPEERQTLLFSATMPPPIRVLSETFLKNPKQIQVQRTEAQKSDIKQLYYVIDEHERDDATVRLIDSMNPSKAVVFCRTKKEADRVAGTLAGRGMIARPIHGDLDRTPASGSLPRSARAKCRSWWRRMWLPVELTFPKSAMSSIIIFLSIPKATFTALAARAAPDALAWRSQWSPRASITSFAGSSPGWGHWKISLSPHIAI